MRALLLTLLLVSGQAAAQHLPPLTSLADIGSKNTDTRAMLVLFSQPDCSYCDVVRSEFLLPLQQQPPKGLSIREFKVAEADSLLDREGNVIAPQAFARRYDIRFFPTVALIGPDGDLLSKPLIGISSREFYGYYLDQAISQALAVSLP